MPLNLPRPMRTASLLFDTPRLPSEEARASFYAIDETQKGKSTAWRRDRKNHGTMPLCKFNAIDFATAHGGVPVKMAPGERLAYVNVGEVNDVGGGCFKPGGDYPSYLYDGKNATLKAFWVERDATIELKPNRKLSGYSPINPADGSGCRYWFEQAANSTPLTGEGKVVVCTTNKKGGSATARWISALIVPTQAHTHVSPDETHHASCVRTPGRFIAKHEVITKQTSPLGEVWKSSVYEKMSEGGAFFLVRSSVLSYDSNKQRSLSRTFVPSFSPLSRLFKRQTAASSAQSSLTALRRRTTPRFRRAL